MHCKKFIALTGIACLTLATAIQAQNRQLSDKGQLLDRIVAVVNDGVVLQSELDRQMVLVLADLQRRGTKLPPINIIKQQVLDRLVVRKIQSQFAAMSGIAVSDVILNSYLETIAQRNDVSFAELPAELAKSGVDYRQYREEMREEITIDLLRQRDVLRRIRVSPKELEQHLEAQRVAESASNEFLLSHILISVSPSSTPDTVRQLEEKATDIYRRLQSGEDFCELALAYSDGQQALECGDLGWRKGAQLPGFLGELVIDMQKGDVSEPARNPSGFHIVRVNEIRGTEVKKTVVSQHRSRHILIQTDAIVDDPTARQQLLDIKERIADGEDFGTIATAVSADPVSARDSGNLGWQTVGSFVPAFEEMLQTLEIGELSAPFKSSYGWHIAQLLERREYDNTDDLRRQLAFQEIRAARASEETEVWIQRLRDDAFVEYRL
ncbi:MAG: peptidylprolyl isomerase [Gammaproteobacteria bacterium]|nr:peptidylprolyl isomerase [Gammaproteobacteria bacterium]MCZ6911479.1 peptidylprolyl isomerase [Pseudomonadota bacterium]